jgi:hypothetical protein
MGLKTVHNIKPKIRIYCLGFNCSPRSPKFRGLLCQRLFDPKSAGQIKTKAPDQPLVFL